MQFTVYQVPLLLTSLVSVIVMLLLLKRKKTQADKYLYLFMTSILIWSIADFFELLNVSLYSKLLWANVSYFGVATFSVFLFMFVLTYIGKEEYVNRLIFLLFVIPTITIILVWTNEYHHLMRQLIFIQNISGVLVFGKTYGIWFWVQYFYNNILVILSTILIFYALGVMYHIYKKQAILFLLGIFIPWAANLFYVSNIIAFPTDMTSVSFAITGLLLFWGISREQLLDIMPNAYLTAFKEIPECVIVLGGINQIVDLNPSAESIFNVKISDIRGKKIQELLDNWKELIDTFNNHYSDDYFKGAINQGNKYYDISIQKIYTNKHHARGELIVLHDITQSKIMENILEESNKQIDDLNDTLQIINKILIHDLSNKLMTIKSTLWLYEETKNTTLINKLNHSIDSGIDIIDRIRDLESFLLKKEDLKSISVKKIAEYVSSSINFPVTIRGDAKVLADEALFSIFENIMRNAIIHGKTDRIDMDISSKDKVCEIRITDDGQGIPDLIKDNVFEEGLSYGNRKGSGLGLYIVKKTIERYGGAISVEDNKPKGAIFIIKLKCARD